MLPDKLAFVDVETTGGNAIRNKIIEIGILRVEQNTVVQTFETLLNPEQPIPPFISAMTGISTHDLDQAPVFAEVMEQIYTLLEGCTFVAHNVKFDYSFVRNEFRRQEYSFSSPLLCSAQLSRTLFPQYRQHNLDVIMKRFNISCPKRHRAFGDAQVMWSFYQHLLSNYSHEKVREAVHIVTKAPTIPPQLSRELFDTLPEQPGVYIFSGEQETPLYIGKSKNIRDRVCAHFSREYRKPLQIELEGQIRDIQYITTAGNLGAQLLESRLIKEQKPLLNKRLRQWDQSVVLVESTNEGGYKTAEILQTNEISPDLLPSVLHVSKSIRSAKELIQHLFEEYALCPGLVGVEKPVGACFGYKISRCKGACLQEEPPALYNMRFHEAFAKKRIPRWPFAGFVLIQEDEPFTQHTETHIFDRWCYLGTATTQQELYDITESVRPLFDYDLYMILKGYLSKVKNHGSLKVLRRGDPQS